MDRHINSITKPLVPRGILNRWFNLSCKVIIFCIILVSHHLVFSHTKELELMIGVWHSLLKCLPLWLCLNAHYPARHQSHGYCFSPLVSVTVSEQNNEDMGGWLFTKLSMTTTKVSISRWFTGGTNPGQGQLISGSVTFSALNKVQKLLCIEPLPDFWAPHPISMAKPCHPAEKTHLSCLMMVFWS